MNALSLVCHVMWFDLRARRRELALWALVLLAQAALLIIGPGTEPTTRSSVSYDLGILIVRFGLTIVLAALLVQSDGLVGTTSFWMSRPIPRGLLFTAKLASAVLWLVLGPVAVMWAALAWLGLGPTDALRGAWMIGLEQAVILSMAGMAAIVTANVGQLIVAGIAGVTLVSTYNGLILPSLTLAWPSVGATLSSYQPTVYITTVIACGLAITAYQYLRLRAWHSVVFIAVAMLLATTLTRVWPSPGPIPDMPMVPSTVMNTAAISLSAPTQGFVDDVARMVDGKRTIERRIFTDLNATGQPDDVMFWPVYATSRLHYQDALHVQWAGPPADVAGDRSAAGEEGQPWQSIHRALGNVDIAMPRGGTLRVQVSQLAEDQYYRHTFVPGQLDADITMVAGRYRVAAAVQVRAGARFRVTGRTESIEAVTSLSPGARLQIRETFLDRKRSGNYDYDGGGFYVLRNTARGQAVLLAPIPLSALRATVGIAATGVVTQTNTISIEIPTQFAARFPIDDAWLREAELVLVEPEILGLLTRPLRVDGFRFADSGQPSTPEPESRSRSER